MERNIFNSFWLITIILSLCIMFIIVLYFLVLKTINIATKTNNTVTTDQSSVKKLIEALRSYKPQNTLRNLQQLRDSKPVEITTTLKPIIATTVLPNNAQLKLWYALQQIIPNDIFSEIPCSFTSLPQDQVIPLLECIIPKFVSKTIKFETLTPTVAIDILSNDSLTDHICSIGLIFLLFIIAAESMLNVSTDKTIDFVYNGSELLFSWDNKHNSIIFYNSLKDEIGRTPKLIDKLRADTTIEYPTKFWEYWKDINFDGSISSIEFGRWWVFLLIYNSSVRKRWVMSPNCDYC